MDFEEKEMLRSFDLDLLVENIVYFMTYKDGVEWVAKPGHFAYPVYPEGMRLYELINYMGGFDLEYDKHIKEIFAADLYPTDLSFQEIRTYLTYIFRGEKFCDGHIAEHMENLILLKLCLRLDDLVRRCMWKERPRRYSLHYLQSLKEGVTHDELKGIWTLKQPLDDNGSLLFYVSINEKDDMPSFKLACVEDQTEYVFERESVIRKLSPFSHMLGSQYKLLGQLLREQVEHNGDELIRKILMENCEKGYQRHYRIPTGLVFKVDPKNMAAYRYQPENQIWKVDYSLFVDFERGEFLDYEEIKLDDVYPVTKMGPKIIIGRHQDCGIVINEPFASKQHALVFYEEGKWYVKDLHSKNGLRVNRQDVKLHPLKMGDIIQVGLKNIIFHGTYLDVIDGDFSKEIYLLK